MIRTAKQRTSMEVLCFFVVYNVILKMYCDFFLLWYNIKKEKIQEMYYG